MYLSQTHKVSTVVVSMITLGFSSPLLAQTESQLDPLTGQVLQQMSQTLQAANAFTFQAETTVDKTSQTGQKVQYATTLDISVRRPVGLQANAVGDRVDRSFWYDGASITLLDRLQNVYATAAAPADMDEALDYAVEQFGVSTPLADLVFSNPYAILTANIQTSNYLGPHQVAGKSCHYLAFTQELIDWQIWISEDANPLPCKMVITYKTEPASPQFTAVFTNWNLTPQLDNQAFQFQAPPDSTQIEFLPSLSSSN